MARHRPWSSLAVVLTVHLLVAVPAKAECRFRWVAPLPQGNVLRSAASGGGAVVVAGDGGAILASRDGVTFEPAVAEAPTGRVDDLLWDGTRFVAVGTEAGILTSADGLVWTRTGNAGASAIAFDGQRYLRIESWTSFGAYGYAWRSQLSTGPDLASWSSPSPTIDGKLNDVAWTGTEFVAVGGGGMIVHTTDGTSWTIDRVAGSPGLAAIATRSGTAVVVGSSDFDAVILVSTDGSSWVDRSPSDSGPLNAVTATAEGFLAAGSDGRYLVSEDGWTWRGGVADPNFDLHAVASFVGRTILAGERGELRTTTDGLRFDAAVARLTPDDFVSLASHETGVVALDASGAIWENVGVEGWRWRGAPVPGLRAVAGGPWGFVAVGADGNHARRRACGAWEAFTGLLPAGVLDVVWAGDRFVAAGGSHLVASTDGASWEALFSPIGDLRRVYWDGSRVLLYAHDPYVGDGVTLAVSPDFATWTTTALPPVGGCLYDCRRTLSGFASDGETFVLLGNEAGDPDPHVTFSVGRVFRSADGVSWEETSLRLIEGLEQPTATLYREGRFLATFRSGRMLSSRNGVDWVREPSPTRVPLTAIVGNADAIVAVGEGGTIIRRACRARETVPATRCRED